MPSAVDAGFGAAGRITFGGVSAVVKSWSDTEILCTVPEGLSGTVAVAVTAEGGSSNRASFTVTPPPPPRSGAGVISRSSPKSARSGKRVTIRGTGFGAGGTAADFVTFGGVNAAVKSWKDTRIVVIVPEGLSGQVEVTVSNAAGTSNPFSFRIKERYPEKSGREERVDEREHEREEHGGWQRGDRDHSEYHTQLEKFFR